MENGKRKRQLDRNYLKDFQTLHFLNGTIILRERIYYTGPIARELIKVLKLDVFLIFKFRELFSNRVNSFKKTVSEISSDPPCKNHKGTLKSFV